MRLAIIDYGLALFAHTKSTRHGSGVTELGHTMPYQLASKLHQQVIIGTDSVDRESKKPRRSHLTTIAQCSKVCAVECSMFINSSLD